MQCAYSCHELLQDTKVEDPNAVYLMKGNPHTESKTCKGHTQAISSNKHNWNKLNQTYIGWADTGPDAVNETQVQTVSANESGQRIMGNEVFDGVLEVWDGVLSREAQGQ